VGACPPETTEEILDYFFSQGGNFIDTSNNYQFEESERRIGAWMKKRNNRDQIVIATKYTTNYLAVDVDAGIPSKAQILVNFNGNGSKSMHLSVRASLEKLGTDYIDLVSSSLFCPLSASFGWVTNSTALRPLVGFLRLHPGADAKPKPPCCLRQGPLPRCK
jgi:hypothetical protein